MENSLSSNLEWFVGTLQKEFGIEVEVKDIGIEATELGTDEVEAFFVPTELVEEIPATLDYEIMDVDDMEGNVWIGAIATSTTSSNWYLEVITKNNILVYRKLVFHNK